MNTSAVAIRRFNACFADGSRRSRAIERLLRLVFKNAAESPLRRLLAERVASPPSGFSTLITSAPWSARIMVARGPETLEVRSTTRYPCKGPGILGFPTHDPLIIRYRRTDAKASAVPVPSRGAALRMGGRTPSNDNAEPVSL